MWLIWLLVSLTAYSIILWKVKEKRGRLLGIGLLPLAPAFVFLFENKEWFEYTFFSTHAVFDIVVFGMLAGILMLAGSIYVAHATVLGIFYFIFTKQEKKKQLKT
nr:hypothetical protein [Jeotgalibacillus malaysiensis]